MKNLDKNFTDKNKAIQYALKLIKRSKGKYNVHLIKHTKPKIIYSITV